MAEIESYHSQWAAQFFAAAELSRRGYEDSQHQRPPAAGSPRVAPDSGT